MPEAYGIAAATTCLGVGCCVVRQNIKEIVEENLYQKDVVGHQAETRKQIKEWADQEVYGQERLIAAERMFTSIDNGLSELDLSDLKLDSLPSKLPRNLLKLDIRDNPITSFPELLPAHLTHLYTSPGQAKEVMKYLIAACNKSSAKLSEDQWADLVNKISIWNKTPNLCLNFLLYAMQNTNKSLMMDKPEMGEEEKAMELARKLIVFQSETPREEIERISPQAQASYLKRARFLSLMCCIPLRHSDYTQI